MEDIELKIYEAEKSYIEDLIENAEKYIKIAKEVAKRFNAKAFVAGSYGTERFTKASDLDIVIVVKDKRDIDKIRFELRKIIKNPRVNFHIITKEFEFLYR